MTTLLVRIFFVVMTALVLGLSPLAFGQKPEVKYPASCKVFYSVLREDALHNVNQGIVAVFSTSGTYSSKEKSPQHAAKGAAKWLKQMAKEYPDVCYASPNTTESVEFVIATTPAVYHGTDVENESHTFTNSNGDTIQTTSSVAVPYETNYNVLTLTVEKEKADGKYEVLRRFQMSSLHPVFSVAGIPCASFGKGKHPIANVMKEAIKWIHEGGLNNRLQSVFDPK